MDAGTSPERGYRWRMFDPAAILGPRVSAAIEAAFGLRDVDPVLRPSQFADVQVNAALALAKQVGAPPRDVATRLVAALDADGAFADVAAKVEVSGPGFLNITLRDDWIAAQVGAQAGDPRRGLPTPEPQVVPIDYSAPNVAKEMHVGHLRTTVVGDALARTLEALGHRVVRQNHIGDWGTPFGMLIEHLLEVGEDSDAARLLETDPNTFYQAARAKFDAEEGDFATRSRARVVALQGGDEATLAIWRRMIELSKHYFNRIYTTLDVTLRDEHLAGESTYDPMLEGICDELEAKGLAVVSQGALCVFPPGFTGRDGTPLPLIIRKSDGGYGYATTDLATIKHRAQDLHADRILYVVGAPQHLHLSMIFEVARLAGWLGDTEPVHVQIGNVLGADGKILKTRSGAPIRLMALLEEAVERAGAVVDAARGDLDDDERSAIARQVGIGAVKYADLSVAHDTEYVFDFDRMLALNGNTGPYLQYAAARIYSIFRKAGLDPADARGAVVLGEPAERALGLALLDFGAVVGDVAALLAPHRLCTYLFELAQAFTAFYDACPVLTAPTDELRASRLALTAAVLGTLVEGLDLLGIAAPERM
ncbi:arginyl-tRNA synthetase [Beutenbergia cavernae DSM 12333]|uniref:Arginine--tRNA ligase n=2 Tax=Beutenbergia TaxID=84756 RepID=C5BXZ8_BEUC1|nr:arginyl-tRNA synthetase [Beutenbergia cavernae DSM 12333]